MIHDLEMLFALIVLGLAILAIPAIGVFVLAKLSSPNQGPRLPSILETDSKHGETKSEDEH